MATAAKHGPFLLQRAKGYVDHGNWSSIYAKIGAVRCLLCLHGPLAWSAPLGPLPRLLCLQSVGCMQVGTHDRWHLSWLLCRKAQPLCALLAHCLALRNAHCYTCTPVARPAADLRHLCQEHLHLLQPCLGAICRGLLANYLSILYASLLTLSAPCAQNCTCI